MMHLVETDMCVCVCLCERLSAR